MEDSECRREEGSLSPGYHKGEAREREAMKFLEDEQKQKTALELLDQYLHFVQEAEQEDNNKKTK